MEKVIPVMRPMNYRTALNSAFEAFDLKASEISKKSGIGENQISNYRQGKKDLYAENLQKIINSLPSEAKMYFYGILLQSKEQTLLSLRDEEGAYHV